MVRALALPCLFVILLLAGCASDPGEQEALHVFVMGGTVTESGPEPDDRSVCDVAAPPFSADAQARRIWLVSDEHWTPSWPVDIAVFRLDRIDELYDDGCWVMRMESTDGNTLELQWGRDQASDNLRIDTGDVPSIGGTTVQEGDVVDWHIQESCLCSRHGVTGQYSYEGTLKVQYLGAWSKADVTMVSSYRDLPPFAVPDPSEA